MWEKMLEKAVGEKMKEVDKITRKVAEMVVSGKTKNKKNIK